ncbi:hypothetical protein [Lactobacillus jensenii]|uniref:Uncharacterized protein n=2 Tax=Lactobacillus TaxID=1578 RepID=A0ABU9FL35_LACJE|nr:hypothetical protein [Lactobacillus jensenii]DAR66695.1 MAG TPA: hypothetical protein [Caudoviricetes sp.]MCW8072267.1 hypothetical protein [Lactobacillus jensenii]MCW8090147.1 hypothetical protein [Lactobacillus jensenii]MDK8236056.1 hypothetical protein [Lactobacillus jensenii]MDT9544344.1 hypothetical protein [Lactobacillus jensenii]
MKLLKKAVEHLAKSYDSKASWEYFYNDNGYTAIAIDFNSNKLIKFITTLDNWIELRAYENNEMVYKKQFNMASFYTIDDVKRLLEEGIGCYDILEIIASGVSDADDVAQAALDYIYDDCDDEDEWDW